MSATFKVFVVLAIGTCHAAPSEHVNRAKRGLDCLFGLPLHLAEGAIHKAESFAAPTTHIFESVASKIPFIGGLIGGHGGHQGGALPLDFGGLLHGGALGGSGGAVEQGISNGLASASHLGQVVTAGLGAANQLSHAVSGGLGAAGQGSISGGTVAAVPAVTVPISGSGAQGGAGGQSGSSGSGVGSSASVTTTSTSTSSSSSSSSSSGSGSTN